MTFHLFLRKNPFGFNLNYLLSKFKSKRFRRYNFLLKIITFRISEKIKYVTRIRDWMKNATENLPKYANLNPLKLEEIPPKRWKHQLSQNERNLLKLFKLKARKFSLIFQSYFDEKCFCGYVEKVLLENPLRNYDDSAIPIETRSAN